MLKKNNLRFLEKEQKQADSGRELAFGRWEWYEETVLFIMAFSLRIGLIGTI